MNVSVTAKKRLKFAMLKVSTTADKFFNQIFDYSKI